VFATQLACSFILALVPAGSTFVHEYRSLQRPASRTALRLQFQVLIDVALNVWTVFDVLVQYMKHRKNRNKKIKKLIFSLFHLQSIVTCSVNL